MNMSELKAILECGVGMAESVAQEPLPDLRKSAQAAYFLLSVLGRESEQNRETDNDKTA